MTKSQIVSLIQFIWINLLRDEVVRMVDETSSPIDNIVVEILDSMLQYDANEWASEEVM